MSRPIVPMRDLVPVPEDDFRALTLHDVVPAGHIAVPVLHSRWEPHLRPGEFAILDPSDVEPQHGELYGLSIQSPRYPSGTVLKIVQPYRSKLFAGCDGVTFRFGQHRPGVLHYVDGPLSREGWRKTCRGRVVGILSLADVKVAHV